MAFKLPKIDFSDTKIRIAVVLSAVMAVVVVIYVLIEFISPASSVSSGNAKLADTPGNLNSIPGGNLTPDYYRALVAANKQAVTQAKISGDSAVPTLLNNPELAAPNVLNTTKSCSIACPNAENIKAAYEIERLIKNGKISAADSQIFLDLAKKGVAVSTYAATLNNLVKAGKLTPDQARKILDNYSQEHTNQLKRETGKLFDQLIQAGQLPLVAANDLLNSVEYNKAHANKLKQEQRDFFNKLVESGQISPEMAADLINSSDDSVKYAKKLNKLVADGTIAVGTANAIFAQHMKQMAKENADDAIGQIEEMASTGKIDPAVAQELIDYHKKHVPIKQYAEELQHLVTQGKLTPEQAKLLLQQYENQSSPEVAKTLDSLIRSNAPIASYENALDKMVADGQLTPQKKAMLLSYYKNLQGSKLPNVLTNAIKQEQQQMINSIQDAVARSLITPEVGKQLTQLQQQNPSVEEYTAQIDKLVQAGNLPPAMAKALVDKYQKLHDMQAKENDLQQLQDSRAPIDEYAAALQAAVAEHVITPEQAEALLKNYTKSQTNLIDTAIAPALAKVSGSKEFAELQLKVKKNDMNSTANTANTKQFFASSGLKSKNTIDTNRLARIQKITDGMANQATQLIAAWQPPTMSGQLVVPQATADSGDPTKIKGGSAAEVPTLDTPLIKAGTIVYAVLNTEANSDYSDSPVLATIVQGEFKGAKLIGKLIVPKQGDKIALNFMLMNMDDWPTGKTISAVAIDPDTARTALASSVDYHRLVRYSGLFASAFLQGYANAVNNSGTTTTITTTGTQETHPNYKPSDKIMAGFGQVGTAMGSKIAGYFDIPPTIKINSGVSLGIMFTANLTK